MRKCIKLYIQTSFGLWAISVVLFSVGKATDVPRFVGILAIVIAISYMFFTLFITSWWTNSGLDKDWFKTREQLQDERQKIQAEWKKADDFIKVLGRHEAVKLWEEAKKEKVE